VLAKGSLKISTALSLQTWLTRKKGKMRRREPAVNWYIGIRRGGHIGTLIGCLISTSTHHHINTATHTSYIFTQ